MKYVVKEIRIGDEWKYEIRLITGEERGQWVQAWPEALHTLEDVAKALNLLNGK